MAQKSTNVFWHEGQITREDRERAHGHRGVLLWLTGLSGSGKSTVAVKLEELLFERGIQCYRLDGDNIRHGLNGDLGFSPKDREENIRRIGEVSKLFVDAGVVVLTSLISPYRADRDKVRETCKQPRDFVEVFVDCPIEECENRDTKGLYKKARAGQIPEFTGISAPYEAPEKAEIVLQTAGETVEQSAQHLFDYLEANGYLSVPDADSAN